MFHYGSRMESQGISKRFQIGFPMAFNWILLWLSIEFQINYQYFSNWFQMDLQWMSLWFLSIFQINLCKYMFPKGFEWIRDGSPMDFQVISNGVLLSGTWFQIDFSCIWNGFRIDVRRISNAFSMDSKGSPMDLSWIPNACQVHFQWVANGFANGFPIDFKVIPIDL